MKLLEEIRAEITEIREDVEMSLKVMVGLNCQIKQEIGTTQKDLRSHLDELLRDQTHPSCKEQVVALLELPVALTNTKIARIVGCDESYVRRIRQEKKI